MLAGGESGGVTLTSDEKAGYKVLENRSASSRLNRSDHFWSSSVIFVSVELLSEDFLVLEGNLTFLLSFLEAQMKKMEI